MVDNWTVEEMIEVTEMFMETSRKHVQGGDVIHDPVSLVFGLAPGGTEKIIVASDSVPSREVFRHAVAEMGKITQAAAFLIIAEAWVAQVDLKDGTPDFDRAAREGVARMPNAHDALIGVLTLRGGGTATWTALVHDGPANPRRPRRVDAFTYSSPEEIKHSEGGMVMHPEGEPEAPPDAGLLDFDIQHLRDLGPDEKGNGH